MNHYGKPKLIDGFQVWDVDQLLIAGQYDPNHDSNYAPDNQIGVISIFYLGNFKIPCFCAIPQNLSIDLPRK